MTCGHERLVAAAESALEDLECILLKCWCFTRAAMRADQCPCLNCEIWRKLNEALPREGAAS